MDTDIFKSTTRRESPDRYFQLVSWVKRCVKAQRLQLRTLLYRVQCHFLCQLGLFKFVFSIMRLFRPVFIFRKVLIVTRACEVREVLGRFDDFTLGESIVPGMPWGDFLMTADWRQQHAQERAWLQSAVGVTADSVRLRAIISQRCQLQIAAAKGEIDVVSDLLEPVVVDIADKYFGVPPLGGSVKSMADAMRDLAGIIMVKPPIDSKPWLRSRGNIAKITEQVVNEIAAVSSPAGSPVVAPGDLLTRFVHRLGTPGAPLWFDEDWIRRYLTGLLATGGATIVRAAASAIDQILAHPDALQEARNVAIALTDAETRGDKQRADALRTTLRHFVYEALRFRPMLPLLLRDTPRDTVIAYGTKKSRCVRAGTRVLAPPLSAMFDQEAVPDPSRFDATRQFEQYLHFGFGARECFGRYIAEIALLEVFRAVLLLKELTRKSDAKGQLSFDGPVASGLVVEFKSNEFKSDRQPG